MGSSAAANTLATPLHTLLEHAVGLGISHFDITPSTRDPQNTEAAIALALAPLLPRRDSLTFSARIGLGSYPQSLPGFGSRKRLLAGLDRLLLHTGLDYLDLLYAHRYDIRTPLEETTAALASAVQQGKVLYAGLSGYAPSKVRAAVHQFNRLGTPLVACQASYSLLDRWIEDGLLDLLGRLGIGCVAAAPLSHGALTHPPLPTLGQTPRLPDLLHIATGRRQSLPQLAVSWALRYPRITSALITASRPHHLTETCAALDRLTFTSDELAAIDTCCPPPERRPSPAHVSTAP
ncbi:aldo/keto reductase [Streptomyces syringium]|uniref:aldo/keto reductase n=1 Tax=Streptomyces syringium TaxID=76729 RepID=UPI00345737CC